MNTSIYMQPSLLKQIKIRATKESRSVPSMITLLLIQAYGARPNE